MAKQSSPSLIADNRKARHDFNIHETYEAGIALTGTEIKSIRQGKLNLKDSFCRIDKGELLLYGVHISPYEQGNRFNHEPERTRKLLMHKSEINKLHAQVKEKGFSLVPLNFHCIAIVILSNFYGCLVCFISCLSLFYSTALCIYTLLRNSILLS